MVTVVMVVMAVVVAMSWLGIDNGGCLWVYNLYWLWRRPEQRPPAAD